MDVQNSQDSCAHLENIICVDYGNRGIGQLWQKGSLKRSIDAILIQDKNRPSYIETGFCCMFDRCETDGPLGSTILCATLRSLGFNVSLLSDSFSEQVVKASSFGNPVKIINNSSDISDIAFIVSVERPGRSSSTGDFRTMKARDISHCTAPIDLLFPIQGEKPKPYLTIGIGDGGNEVGTGNISSEVTKYVPFGDQISTNICCDILIMSGVSNWGAIALAAGLVIESRCEKSARTFIEWVNKQPEILSKMLEAGSFDGCSGKSEMSIDGMKFDKEHLQISKSIVSIVNKALNLC